LTVAMLSICSSIVVASRALDFEPLKKNNERKLLKSE
jgi:hypothetical protein